MSTKENHPDDLKKNNYSETGNKEYCIWNNVKDFHVVENYTVDIMHYIYEGVCHYYLGAILHYLLIELKLFSYT